MFRRFESWLALYRVILINLYMIEQTANDKLVYLSHNYILVRHNVFVLTLCMVYIQPSHSYYLGIWMDEKNLAWRV